MYTYSNRLKTFGLANSRSHPIRQNDYSIKDLPLKSTCLDEVFICKEAVMCKGNQEINGEKKVHTNLLGKTNIVLSANKCCGGTCSNESNTTSCCICLEEYKVGDSIAWSRHPECNHAFHKVCIGKWLESSNGCPICRKPFYCKKTVVQQEKHQYTISHTRVSRSTF